MIISNSRRYIFVHVPQTGSGAVASMLEAELRWNDVVVGSADVGECAADAHADRFGMRQHSLPSEIRRALGDATYLSYVKFCVMRNPVARLASATAFIRQLLEDGVPWVIRTLDHRERHELRSVRSLRDMVRTEFLNSVADRVSLGLQESLSDVERCVAPQSAFVDEEERQNGRFACLRGSDGQGLISALRSMGVAALPDAESAIAAPEPDLASGPVLSDGDMHQIRQLYRRDLELIAGAPCAPVS